MWYFGQVVWSETSGLAPDVKVPVAAYVASSTDINTLTKTADVSQIGLGDYAEFTLTVTNNDAVTRTFSITDVVPANSAYVTGTATGGLTYDSMADALYAEVELDAASIEMYTTTVYGYVDLSDYFAPLPCSNICDETYINLSGLEPFYWNGQMYDSIGMVSNGYAIPGEATDSDVDYINQLMPDADVPNNVLAPWWTDLDLDGTDPGDAGGGIWYAGILYAGSDAFNILEWRQAELYGDPDSVYTFQIWMLAGTDFIWYVYEQLDGDVSVASVGAEDGAGTVGTTLYYDGAGTLPVVGDEWAVAAVPGGSATMTFKLEATAADAEILNEASASNDGGGLYSAWAYVDVRDVGLQVAHLAPFAMDPGTAVTVTLNGAPALTDFAYGDSTGYIDLDPGTYLVEIFPQGSPTAAISATVELTTGVDYTAIAVGDGVNQPLSLLALVDDNTPPAEGNAHLRLGHLAPFAADPDTVADVRLDDGTVILDDVSFGDVAGYTPLAAGEYDLKITTPDGMITLISLAPVTLADGDIISAFAVGDGVNQPLGGYALPAGAEGFFLPLEEYLLYLPLVMR
jgi:uncharacterized repeat protein (TIGR01451 family)